MSTSSNKGFFRRHLVTLLIVVGVLGYIYVAGTSDSCSMCSAMTDFALGTGE